jgi:HK97 family phage major capsid protein
MNLKEMLEKRAALHKEMSELVAKADSEKRAITEDEQKKFDELEKEIKGIDAFIEAEKRARALELSDRHGYAADGSADTKGEDEAEAEKRAKLEEKVFEDYLRGKKPEERADVNFTLTDNGAVVPSSIANKIIDKIKEICPIFALSEIYQVGGELQIPYYDTTAGDIAMGYSDEFVELEATAGKFSSISLKGFLGGALTKIGRRLINNSKFDVVNWVIDKMAQNTARFIERELLLGTDDKIQGLRGVTLVKTAASQNVITADELIDVQEEVIDFFQPDAVWIMNRATRKAIRKLKDADGNFILNRDFTTKWNYTLLGRPVYTSDNMPAPAAGKTVVFYGDMKGLATKISEDVSIQVLLEKYATQHAVGIVGWTEFDAKVQNAQMISALKMAAAS